MAYTYDQRKRSQGAKNTAPKPSAGPDLDALMTGAATPTAAQKGRPIDLEGAIKAKMEHAFGDLSAVKLYESTAVGQAGAEAIARGSEIAFAPGMADFSSRSGQERLGHELSHVMSQRSGAVREGAMAAAGEQVYTGPVTHALTATSPSPAAAGPMQAKRRDDTAQGVKEMTKQGVSKNSYFATPDFAGYDDLGEGWEEQTHSPGFSRLWGKKNQRYKVRTNTLERGINGYEPHKSTPELNPLDPSKMTRNFDLKKMGLIGIGDHYTKNMAELSLEPNRPGREDLYKRITDKQENRELYEGGMEYLQNSDGSVRLAESGRPRQVKDLWGSSTSDMSDEEIETLFDNMYAPRQKELHQPGADPEKIKAADEQFDSAMYQLKEIYYKQLKRLEATYGTLPTQMHPEDFLKQVGPEFFEHAIGQDWSVLMKSGTNQFGKQGRYFDFENDKKDQEFKRLADYYKKASIQLYTYGSYIKNPSRTKATKGSFEAISPEIRVEANQEKGIGGPRMTRKQLKQYNKDLKKRAKEGGWSKRLFGRYN